MTTARSTMARVPRAVILLAIAAAITACDRGLSEAERKHLIDSVRGSVLDSVIRDQIGPAPFGAAGAAPAPAASPASPAAPGFTAADSARMLAARRDLLQLAVRQEAYFVDHMRYANDASALGVTQQGDASLRITDSNEQGYLAEAVLMNPYIRCVVAVGPFANTPLLPGVPKCL